MSRLEDTLKQLKDGKITVEEAALKIKSQPFEDLGYAKVDLHREVRQGTAEVIYAQGKTAQQIIGIVKAMNGSSQRAVTGNFSQSARA